MCRYPNRPDPVTWVQSVFPNLGGGGFVVTSEDTCGYNCIAWAAEDIERWWWPSEYSYWPEDPPFEETPEAFEVAFRNVRGYEPWESGELEPGYQKVVIYAAAGRTTHMARQLEDGTWTSKLGEAWDIQHLTLEGMEGRAYGQAVRFMRRRREER